MNRTFLSLAIALLSASPAFAEIVAKPQTTASAPDAATAKFAAVLQQALAFIGKADSYRVNVNASWKATGDEADQQGKSSYQLFAQGPRHRVTVQAAGAQSPNLIYVCDGEQATTFLPARALYSQHAVGSPQASLESNHMLAVTLAGSGIDVLLQPNIGQFVQSQASEVKYHGEESLTSGKAHHFEVQWQGAKVELWFATQGDPLLTQFTRTAVVPTGEKTKYEMVHTARFSWEINAAPPAGSFKIELPKDARRVSEIYDALSGDEPASRLGKAVPKMQLTRLDGSQFDVAVPEGKRGVVLIFWATWCSPSVDEMPAVSQFVKAYSARGLTFYAVNVGERPADVRRFTAKSPLESAVVLDPQGKASSALRVLELPAVVVINPDNTVRAIHHGPTNKIQTQLAQDLDSLLATPSNTARRPGEGVPK